MKLKFCFLFLLSINVCYASKKPLYFGFINTFTGPFSISEAVPVVDIVLEHVNNRSDILQNYTLHYTKLLDSKCNRTVSLDAFFKLVNGNTNIVSLLGCGCPVATVPVAEISHYWNIPQLSFTSISSELSDRSRFRNLFHILPSLQHTAASTAQLMREFQWKKLAIISQEENSYIPVTFIKACMHVSLHYISIVGRGH
jgi:ABC-type branched-subunit amino acid transport system substrate-binding protein